MLFENREEAAELLVDRLSKDRGQNPLVLGIPRGAVPMAKIIAEALGGELDVVLVHKLGAPGNPRAFCPAFRPSRLRLFHTVLFPVRALL